MNRIKKLVAAGIVTAGIGTSAALFTPSGSDAASNVVLASVEWVNTKLNPINTKLSSLETKISSLEAKVASQQKEIEALKADSGTTTPTTPPPSGLPSAVYTTKDNVSIHSGALRTYKVVATVSKSTALTVVDSHNSSSGLWYRVQLSPSLLGWVYSGDVSTTKPDTLKTVVTTADVNMRRGATTDYAVVELLPKGTVLKLVQTYKNSKGETWYNVETSSGSRGWIISTFGEVR
ncbi:SH3 domain-containing protein [Bacillus sp. CMF12]|uniref:SH3 domain-containing protein n=1 Tax=Bacillaceae TaxID=186817 RepID=UPI001FB24563|nr:MULTISPECIES: SH3 domain-containing protein [Bacillaceae]UOE55126.1 SH3 domain-containing protein [Cytobacillus oceanisediminis]USK49583.1 SH3 domain-containing protein [Bacillus sp. CMF12]